MEFLEKSGGKNKHVCEKCGSEEVQKLLSGFAVGHNSKTSNSCPTGTCPTGMCGL
jgi:hypothetical protein